MSQPMAVLLGAIAGATIFLGLPVARLRGLPTAVQGVLNAFATGILVFLLWDILSHAGGPVETALWQWTGNQGTFVGLGPGPFVLMAAIFGVGVGAGLIGLVYFNRAIFGRLRHGASRWPSPPGSGCTTCQRDWPSASRHTSAPSPSRGCLWSGSRCTTSPRASGSPRR